MSPPHPRGSGARSGRAAPDVARDRNAGAVDAKILFSLLNSDQVTFKICRIRQSYNIIQIPKEGSFFRISGQFLTTLNLIPSKLIHKDEDLLWDRRGSFP
jgi:hypothetical protein